MNKKNVKLKLKELAQSANMRRTVLNRNKTEEDSAVENMLFKEMKKYVYREVIES